MKNDQNIKIKREKPLVKLRITPIDFSEFERSQKELEKQARKWRI